MQGLVVVYYFEIRVEKLTTEYIAETSAVWIARPAAVYMVVRLHRVTLLVRTSIFRVSFIFVFDLFFAELLMSNLM